ncbi:hypothetical protein ACFL08_05355 [Patescibacteria group bacterium]
MILKGFYDFMSDYFNIYPLDLPGFVKNIKPLKKIALDNYANYAKKEIEKLGIKNYWIGGISFGFIIANLIKDQEQCKGILAIEPYLGTSSLNISFIKKASIVMLIQLLRLLNAFYVAWHSPFLQKKLLFGGSSAKLNKRVKKYLSEIDARTFFETASILLLNEDHGCSLKSCPYVLIINKNDDSVLANKIITKFEAEAQNLLITPTTSAHFPEDMSKQYFKDNIKKEDVEKILYFIQNNQ